MADVNAQFEVLRELRPTDGGERGQFNCGIYLVRDRSTGQVCVQKRLNRGSAGRWSFLREARLIHDNRHPNIIGYIDHSWPRGGPIGSIYTEYCDLGALDSMIIRYRQNERPVPEAFVWYILYEMTKALAFLHEGVVMTPGEYGRWSHVAVIHRDIKPGNMFLSSFEGGYVRCVLGDFGIAMSSDDHRDRSGEMLRDVFDRDWSSPEGPSNRRADVFSLGKVICSLCSLQIYGRYINGADDIPAVYSRDLRDLVDRMMNYRAVERIQSKDLLIKLKRILFPHGQFFKLDRLPAWALPPLEERRRVPRYQPQEHRPFDPYQSWVHRNV
ncbi:kinase-like protein [Patellaria atrata CBS 101060]|uniref:non-specific serine/threonine protein kinase n=1 Tax=Patellaria atrata CBS 101060 TaxID=1346257 RepID=A0A9P4VPS0_9PEZI|nr:kinase-like protein [Patellaria atrata CBS 101060]